MSSLQVTLTKYSYNIPSNSRQVLAVSDPAYGESSTVSLIVDLYQYQHAHVSRQGKEPSYSVPDTNKDSHLLLRGSLVT